MADGMLDLNGTGVTIESVLEAEGHYASTIKGVSMRPMLKTARDVVVLQRVNAGERLSRFDVALYKVGEKYVLHRVIDIDENKGVYIIRGDNTYSLEYVKFDSVLARLISFNRAGKHHSVDERSYLSYAAFWNAIYPVRSVLAKCRRALGRVKRAIFKSKNEP